MPSFCRITFSKSQSDIKVMVVLYPPTAKVGLCPGLNSVIDVGTRYDVRRPFRTFLNSHALSIKLLYYTCRYTMTGIQCRSSPEVLPVPSLPFPSPWSHDDDQNLSGLFHFGPLGAALRSGRPPDLIRLYSIPFHANVLSYKDNQLAKYYRAPSTVPLAESYCHLKI